MLSSTCISICSWREGMLPPLLPPTYPAPPPNKGQMPSIEEAHALSMRTVLHTNAHLVGSQTEAQTPESFGRV